MVTLSYDTYELSFAYHFQAFGNMIYVKTKERGKGQYKHLNKDRQLDRQMEGIYKFVKLYDQG